ncbi:C4-dicarboxylate transport system permease small protein [Bacillus freudenreichii]|nr:C4-dicarboxylate transport system permease small protein [Bacillus freudenreichii]
MLEKLSHILNRIEDMLFYLGGLLIIFSMLSITFEVFSRYISGSSILWVNEINEYILLYVPFLGGAWLIRENGHVVIDLIEGKLSKTLNKINYLFIALIGILVCCAFCWYGLQTVIDSYLRDMRSISVLQIPQVYVFLIIPVASFVMLLEFIRMFYRCTFGNFSLIHYIDRGEKAA